MGLVASSSAPARYFVVTVPQRGRHGPNNPWAPGRRSQISLTKDDAERFLKHLTATRPYSIDKSALVLDRGWILTDWATPAKQLDADDFNRVEPVPPEFSTVFS
jgi:hypothetical protein